MRIAYFTETFLPNVNPITLKIRYLLDYLDENGHDSLIFTPRYRGMPTWYKRTNIIPITSIGLPFSSGLKAVLPTKPVDGDLRMFRPDIIHLINPTLLGVAGLRAAKNLDIPVVGSYHSEGPGYGLRARKRGLFRPIYNYYRNIHNKCDLTLSSTLEAQRNLEKNGFERLALWRAGTDVKNYSPEKRSTLWRKRLTAGNPDKPLVIIVSRLLKDHRLDIVLDVLKSLPNVRLAIIGDGPARADLQKRFADTATVFIGNLPEEDLAEVYASGDVFLFVGDNRKANRVIEAMASGLPVVAPREASFVDSIDDGGNGFLYESDDIDSIVTAIRRIVKDTALGWQYSLRGREFAEKRSWTNTIDELFTHYEGLIKVNEPQLVVPSVATGGVFTERLPRADEDDNNEQQTSTSEDLMGDPNEMALEGEDPTILSGDNT